MENFIKRTEKRYLAEIDDVTDKISEISLDQGVKYKGRIRKEKGDVFILDASDGRIYSFTVTRAHLIKAGEKKESETQRQLEIEYAGYLSGFDNFNKNSEKQLAEGMVNLAVYTFSLYHRTPLISRWSFSLVPTHERKYDFVSQIKQGRNDRKLPNLKKLEVLVK